jgi:hypothetical protein
MEVLQAEQFLGDLWGEEGDGRFLAGNHFLKFITFMGCSPYIVFEPPPDGSFNFCHIELSKIYTGIQFRSASREVFARCPQCRKRMNQWEPFISQWQTDSAATDFYCDKCNAKVSLYALQWRQTAGFGRMFMDVYSIHPQEGVPTDPLLALLEKASGTPWQYFYSDR